PLNVINSVFMDAWMLNSIVTPDIVLPCKLDHPMDVVDEMVEWSRSDLNPRFVHVWRSGEDHLVGQNPSYKNRTSVSTEKLKTGDVSLKITKVRLSDEGTYRCFIPGLNANFSVELVLKIRLLFIFYVTVSPGVLECKSKGWYPEPEVFWLENKGKIISAGSKEMLRGPDDLYVLSSRLTLEKGHSNNITCRIQQNNQYREAKIHTQVREKTQRKTQRKIATQKPVLSLQIQKSVQQTKRSLAKVSPQWKKISQEKVQQKIRVNNKNCPQKKEK
uniref:Ig-like domain-containing protein n=1 Tax=Neolamprologus brichardi TaxID=32507 RepID=A0A3Q4MSH5_NEOBR